ncbi:Helicase Polq-Like [Manis pentadactyla]|nr:Helicase Polq-Like [Manis pentadactyla]
MWEDMTLGAEETPMKHCFPNSLQQWKERHGGGGSDGGGGKILFKHVGTSLANTCSMTSGALQPPSHVCTMEECNSRTSTLLSPPKDRRPSRLRTIATLWNDPASKS